MEAQAMVLADLTAAISSMNAKVDDMHSVVLELNRGRPVVERAVDALRAEVGDLRARVISSAHQEDPAAGKEQPPLLPLSADAPSSAKLRAATAASGDDGHGQAGNRDESNSQGFPPVDFESPGGAPTKELFESMSGPLGQPQDAATVMEDKDAQESVNPVTINPSTWYDQFLVPQVPCFVSLHTQMVFEKQGVVVNAQVRPAWSPYVQGNFSNLRSFGQLDSNATVLMFPWNPGGYLRGSSNHRNIGFPATNICSHWPVPGICDALAMRSPFAILCDEWVLPPWDSGQQADVSFDQFSCANRYTSCLPWYFLTGGQMQVSDACSTWQLFLSASSTSLLLAKLLVQTKEPSGILMYVSKLAEAKLIGRFHETESWWNYMLHARLPWRLEVWMGWETIVLAGFANGHDNLQFLMLTLVLEQEPLSIEVWSQRYMALYLVQVLFLFAAPTIRACKTVLSVSILPADGYLCNQSLSAKVCRQYSLKYYLLADKWRSRFLCVGLALALFYAFVLPERHPMETLQSDHLPRWAQKLPCTNARWCGISFHVKGLQDVYVSGSLQLVYCAIGRRALLVLVQSATLKYMDLCKFTTAILTEIMNICSVGCFVQMDVTGLVQPDLLLTPAYQLSSGGWEKLVRIAHKYCVMAPCAISLNDPMVDWHISKHIQSPSNGVMHTVCESLSWSKLICLFNSETTMCAMLVGFLIGNGSQIKSGISNKDIATLPTDAGIATGISHGFKVNYKFETILHRVICASRPSVAPCPASGTTEKTASSNEIFLGKKLYAPWDPGGHRPKALDNGGLRASRMLRRGECHGPCGLIHQVAWADARRGQQAQRPWAKRSKQLCLKGIEVKGGGGEEPEPGPGGPWQGRMDSFFLPKLSVYCIPHLLLDPYSLN